MTACWHSHREAGSERRTATAMLTVLETMTVAHSFFLTAALIKVRRAAGMINVRARLLRRSQPSENSSNAIATSFIARRTVRCANGGHAESPRELGNHYRSRGPRRIFGKVETHCESPGTRAPSTGQGLQLNRHSRRRCKADIVFTTGTHNAELLHSELQGRSIHSESRSSAVKPSDNPLDLFQSS